MKTPPCVGADEHRRTKILDRLYQGLLRVTPLSEIPFLFRKFGSAGDDWSLGIDEQTARSRLVLGQPFALHRGDDDESDSEAHFAGADKEDALGVQRLSGDAACRIQTGQAHRPRALDVVVEATHAVLVAVQQLKGTLVVEVLKLQNGVGKDRRDSGDELLEVVRTAGSTRCRPDRPSACR